MIPGFKTLLETNECPGSMCAMRAQHLAIVVQTFTIPIPVYERTVAPANSKCIVHRNNNKLC